MSDINYNELTKVAAMVNQEILQKNDILPYLLAGGAGALTGGVATALAPRTKDESRLKRLYRILRNATLLGGAVGGGAALIGNSAKRINTVLHPDDPSTKDSIAGNKKVWQGGIAGLGTAGFYAHGYKGDKSRASNLVRELTGRDNVDVDAEYKALQKGIKDGSDPVAKAQRPDERWADALEQRNIGASGRSRGNDRVVPRFERQTIDAQLKALGYNPEAMKPGGSKTVRALSDVINTHGGRVFGRTIPGAIGRAALLGGAYALPSVAEWGFNRSDSTDKLYD